MPDPTLSGSRPLYVEPTLLRADEHSTLGLEPTNAAYDFARHTHIIPVTVGELAETSAHYPLVFMGDDHVPVAVTGLTGADNLFVGDDGRWHEDSYIPAYIRQYPFVLVPTDSGDSALCIDTACDRLTSEGGQPLFSNGQMPPLLQKAAHLCREYEASAAQTRQQIDTLKSCGVFKSARIELSAPNAAAHTLDFVGIEMASVHQCSDAQKAQLVDSGAIAWVIAFGFSQRHWSYLATIARNRTGGQP